MYPDEKRVVRCDYFKEDVTITTKYYQFPHLKQIDKRICSKWDNCDNRQYCKYGKMH